VGRIGPEDHLMDVTVLNDATALDIVSLTTTGTTTSAEEEVEHEEDIYRVLCLELAQVLHDIMLHQPEYVTCLAQHAMTICYIADGSGAAVASSFVADLVEDVLIADDST
jgi:hypothetical protein